MNTEIASRVTAVLIAGPTASGKSGLAAGIARRHGGIVINADSMQVYTELRILTARPDGETKSTAPHRLYGHVSASTRYSVGAWLNDIVPELDDARSRGRLPIIVGGTGLYFKSLTEGLAMVPPIPAEVRQAVRQRAAGQSSEVLHRHLAETDPEDAARIRPSDLARVVRAMEVFETTGRSLAEWRRQPATPVLDGATAERLVLQVDRDTLHRRIAERAEGMITAGALAEAKALSGLGLSSDLPAMRAIGVRQLIEHAAGAISLDQALEAIKRETRQYAKRQATWFRNQMADWRRIDA